MQYLLEVYLKDILLETHLGYILSFLKIRVSWMVFILVCVVVQNVSVIVNLNHVLEFSVDDEVNRIGQLLSEMKLDAKVALFYELKMITRAVVWGQVKTESCVTRTVIAAIDLVACIL